MTETTSEYFTVYVTCASSEEAEAIAKACLADRLVACANILGPMRSLYHWQGAIEDDTEIPLMLKTRAALLKATQKRIESIHSYDVPCIVAWPIVDGNRQYLDWIKTETSG